METRRITNPAMPNELYWAQLGLYLWAAYAVVWGVAADHFSMWEVVFGLARLAAAYGISNEGRWGYWTAFLVCGLTVIPTVNELVRHPGFLLRPDVLVLVAFPLAIFFCLAAPASREFARTWFR